MVSFEILETLLYNEYHNFWFYDKLKFSLELYTYHTQIFT